jgi:hypothetical protein
MQSKRFSSFVFSIVGFLVFPSVSSAGPIGQYPARALNSTNAPIVIQHCRALEWVNGTEFYLNLFDRSLHDVLNFTAEV